MKENQKDQWREDSTTGQQQNQRSHQNQGNFNRGDENSPKRTNYDDKEDSSEVEEEIPQPDESNVSIDQPDEIHQPEKERNIKTPYADNSVRNQGDNQNQSSNPDRNSGRQ